MNAHRWLLAAVLVLLAAPAQAQTRFSLSGGALVPLAKFADTVDPSWRFGVRAEFQSVNAIGKKSRISYYLQAAYSPLSFTDEYKAALEAAGEEADGSYGEVGGGVRVYSRVSLFFISAGAGYARLEPGGSADGENGFDLNAGAGFSIPLYLFKAEAHMTAHEVFIGGDDIQFLDALVSLALPF